MNVLYRFFDQFNELLYIGATSNPWHRFKNHEETKPWFREVSRSTMEHFETRQELIAAEVRAIQTELPKYNSAHMPRARLAPGIRGVGRPEVGTPINVRLGDELLAAIDTKADRLGVSRAALIRMLLEDRMSDEMSTDG